MKNIVLALLLFGFYSLTNAQTSTKRAIIAEGVTPTSTLATPSYSEHKVISLHTDMYNNALVDSWKTDWSLAAYEEVIVENKVIKKYSSLDYVGIETITNQINLNEMTHFHIDMWTPDATFFGVKLVDFGPDGVYGGGDDSEHQINFESPINGEWNSYDISLDEFTSMIGRSNFSQLILVGQPTGNSTIFVDNILFYSTKSDAPFTGLKSPGMSAKSGDVINVPLMISTSPDQEITAIEFKVAKSIDGATVSVFQAFMPEGWLLEVNEIGEFISYAAAGSEPFIGEMTALELNLSVNTFVDVQTQLSISDVVFNENFSIPVELGILSFEGLNFTIPNIFISEYLEGSSNNKALEIFNASDFPVDLSKVMLKQSNNGKGFDVLTEYTLVLSGELAPYHTFVIANPSAIDQIKVKADIILDGSASPGQRVLGFNGDDAIGLFYEDFLIDLFGDPSVDPGTNWSVAGGANNGGGATSEFTLVRKPSIGGNPNPLSSFGTNSEDSEWLVFPQNYESDLSRHSYRTDANVAFLFEVNMETQLQRQTFKPVTRGDLAQLRGNFDGWGSGIQLMPYTDPNVVYYTSLEQENYEWGKPILYKFVYVNGQNSSLITWEAGNDKSIAAQERRYFEDERDEKGFIVIKVKDPIPYFDNVAPDGIFTEPSQVTFQVDLRPAYYLFEDFGNLPMTPEISKIDGVWANGPFLNKQTDGWEAWGANLASRDDLKFVDDGTAGDVVAGDSIFTFVYTFQAGDAKKGSMKLGVNGFDNDTESNQDRILTVEKDEVVNIVFGTFIRENNEPYNQYYRDYVEFIDGKFVVKPRFISGKTIVWPGDTNRDGEVSELDVLPLGQYFNMTGPARSNFSIEWRGFEADLWEVPGATHADTFGDGEVTIDDLAGIAENFGQVIPVTEKRSNNNVTNMDMEIPIPAVKKGEIVRISIGVGNATNPVEGMLGAALRIIVPVQALKFSDLFPVGLLETENLIPFIHFNEQTFELSMAVTRTRLDGGITGFGNFAELEFEAIETVPTGLSLYLISLVTSTETSMNYTPLVGVDVAVTTSAEQVLSVPQEIALHQNFPNPFNPGTQIRYDLPQNGRVAIEVFNSLGQRVATLVNKDMSAGTHTVSFDASNLASGIYLYKMTSGSTSITQKMLLVK